MLNNIIGQEKLKKFITYDIVNDSLSHGYLIEAKRFMGKEYIARQIAEEITDLRYIDIITSSEGRKQNGQQRNI